MKTEFVSAAVISVCALGGYLLYRSSKQGGDIISTSKSLIEQIGDSLPGVEAVDKNKTRLLHKTYLRAGDECSYLGRNSLKPVTDINLAGYIELNSNYPINKRARWRAPEGCQTKLIYPHRDGNFLENGYVYGHPACVGAALWCLAQAPKQSWFFGLQTNRNNVNDRHQMGAAIDLGEDAGETVIYMLKTLGLYFGYCSYVDGKYYIVDNGKTSFWGNCTEGHEGHHYHINLPGDWAFLDAVPTTRL